MILLDGSLVDKQVEISDLLISHDFTVRELISQVEYFVTGDAQLSQWLNSDTEAPPAELVGFEVEGRLGVLHDSATRERLKLPFQSEALLCERNNKTFEYGFVAGLSALQFEQFVKKICAELRLTIPFENMASDPEFSTFSHPPLSRVSKSNTLDQFFDIPATATLGERERLGRSIRVSYPIDENGNVDDTSIVDAISKRTNVVLNIYTGRDLHEDEVATLTNEAGGLDDVLPAVDYRIAVNYEYHVSSKLTHDVVRNACQMSRRRCRRSFPLFGAFRVDCTQISVQPGQHTRQNAGQITYEVELEINPHLLLYHLRRKRHNLPNEFNSLIIVFVNTLRCWCCFLNSTGGVTPNIAPQDSNSQALRLEDLVPHPNQVHAYLQKVSPVLPLIGDYLYRGVALDHSLKKAVSLSPEDIADSERSFLTTEETVAKGIFEF